MFFLLFCVVVCQPNYRDYYSLNHLNEKIIIFGGHKNVTYYNDLWIYTLLNDTWSNYTTELSKRTYTNMWKDKLGKIYLWGGKEELRIANDCWIFENLEISDFFFKSTHPMERYGSIIFEHENGIYMFGGIYSYTYWLFNDMWSYNSISNDWFLLKGSNDRNSIFYNSDLPASRGLSIDWTTSNNLYVYGGFNIHHLNDFWKFNINNLEWILLSENSIPGNQSRGCEFSIENDLFMIGMNDNHLWNYCLGSWSVLDNITYLLHSFNYEKKIYSFNSSFYLVELYEIDFPNNNNSNITDTAVVIDDDDTTIIIDDDTTNGDNNNDVISLVIGIIIPSVIIISFIIIILVVIIVLISYLFHKKSRKLSSIKDLDVILEEQKATKNIEVNFKINKSLFKINYNKIKILEKIGSGGSSSVIFKCKYNNLDIAFKCFHINNWMEESKFREFETELNIIANVRHPYILRFFGATLSEPRFGLILEYCEKGNIKEFLLSYKKKK